MISPCGVDPYPDSALVKKILINIKDVTVEKKTDSDPTLNIYIFAIHTERIVRFFKKNVSGFEVFQNADPD